MYINFWYPMIRSEDLGPDRPERTKVLGLNFAIYRDSKGRAHVLSDTCVHRGGSLGGAWQLGKAPRIVDDCVVCPYHGWEFGSDGACRNIPSIGYGTKPPGRAKVDSYPTTEKYGIVFAFLGDLPESERPPMLEIPKYEDPKWRANSVLVLEVDYYYERSIENGLDPAHNEFVHPTHGFKGINRETYAVRDYEVTDYAQGWGMWFLHRFSSPKLEDKTWDQARTQGGDLYAGSGTHGPATMITEINDGPIHARNKIIAQQDIEILGDVYPPRTPISNTKEVLMPADKAVVAYREWLAKFDDRGWRIDWDEFTRRNGKDTAFAIPSPRRRETGNWVLEPVPMVASRAERKATRAG